MITSFPNESGKISSFLESQLQKRLSKNNDKGTLSQLVHRYMSCLNLGELPSENFLIDYLFSEDSPDINMAAVSCEFYGGIYYRHVESRKSLKNLKDFEQGLSLAYAQLAQFYPQLRGTDEETDKVLAAFRQTTDYLRNQDLKILQLHK